MTDENKKSMPPVKYFRENTSFLNASIFDSSKDKKLLEYIRNTRGRQKARPAFSSPSPENRKRCSFPFEIERIKEPTKESDENNKDVANKLSPGKNNEQAIVLRKQDQLRKFSSRHSPHAAFVTLKRLSGKLGRHVLQKEFEKTQQDGQAFLPAAASTPLSTTSNCGEYGSNVSNIGQCVDDTITNKSAPKQIESECSKAETIKEPKTIIESPLCQAHKSQPQLIETNENDRNLIEKKGNIYTNEIENFSSPREPVHNRISSAANRNLPDNMEIMNISSSSSDSLLSNLDEDIIEPLNGCSSKHGVIYDMSPKSGMKWVDTMIKKKVTAGINRKTGAAKRGSSVYRNADPIPLTYTDMESALQQTLKNKSSKNSRRKLYSKGLSDNEISFDDSPEKLHDTRRRNDSTFKSFGNPNPISKSLSYKKGKHRHCEKFQTISRISLNWQASGIEADKSDRRSETNNVIIADEQTMFKVPQNPVPKSKKIVLNKSLAKNETFAARSNTNQQRINNDRSSNSSTNSEEDLYNSHCVNSIYSNKSMQTAQTNYDQTLHHVNESLRSNATELQSNSIQKERRKFADSNIFKIRPRTNSKQSFIPIKSMNELPVDPDVTKQKQNKSNRSHTSHIAPESANEQNNEIDSILNDRQSDRNICKDTAEHTINQHSSIKKSAKNKVSAANTSANKEVIDLNENKQKTVEDESVIISKIGLLKTKVAGDNIKPKRRGRPKKKINENMKNSETPLLQTETTTSEAGVRRSNRTHRPPRPYWTSCRQNDVQPFTYKESVIPSSGKRSGSRKVATKKRKKEQQQQETQLQSIDERPNNQSEMPHSADDLFDALKGVSMRQAHLDRIEEENHSISPQPNRDSPTPSTSRCEQRLQSVADSGHATDSNNGQYPNDLLLNWLRNLVQPKTIASNPALVKILSSSNISIASCDDILFHDVDGVGFAYYKKASPNDDNYGYMRFFPDSVKKMSKTKHSDLKFLCLKGALHLSTAEETTMLRNGDFVTVPKGIRYALTNKSNEIVLLFFIKS